MGRCGNYEQLKTASGSLLKNSSFYCDFTSIPRFGMAKYAEPTVLELDRFRSCTVVDSVIKVFVLNGMQVPRAASI